MTKVLGGCEDILLLDRECQTCRVCDYNVIGCGVLENRESLGGELAVDCMERTFW